MQVIPNAPARLTTSLPMRPSPSTPSVLPYSSMAGLAFPLARLDGFHVKPEAFRHRDHQAKCVLRDGRFVDARREQHRNLLRRRMRHVDRIEPDAILGDHLQPRKGGVDDFGGDLVVAVEQAVEPAILRDKLEHLRFAERPSSPNDLIARGRQHIVMLAGRVLKTGGGQKYSFCHIYRLIRRCRL